MKRSRSLSNIPMPVNYRGDSKGQRAKSTLRSSRDPSLDRQTPLAQRLGIEFSDKKYRGQKNITPTTYTGFKRSGSVSSFGSRLSLSKNRSPLEKKSLQKLLSDKKWVADQYTKVQKFIQTSGLFNPELSGMIRPPTINIVVELFSCLFSKIIRTDPINSQSYADIVLRTLKLLNYPGSITLSTLKTANTMHGWPHFISIISWLIERVDLSSINNNFREQQEEELKQKFFLQDSVLEFLAAQHIIYTGTPNEIFLEETEDKLYKLMLALTGTDLEAVNNLEQPIENCRAEVAELAAKLNEIAEEIEKIQVQNSERQNAIKKFKESKTTREEDLEVELTQLRELRNKQSKNKKQLTLSIKTLENVVASQSCRSNEKAKILGQIEDLKRAIGRKERKLAEYRAVRDDLDHKLTTIVKEIERKVDAWNVSVTKTLLPELQHLRLREKGFHSKGFVEELRQVLKEKEEVTKHLLQEFKTIMSDIEKLPKERESLIQNNKALNEIKEKMDSLKNYIQSSQEENRNLLVKMDEVKKQFNTNITEIEHLESIKINEAEAEIVQLDDRIKELTEKIVMSSQKGLAILQEAHNTAIRNIQKMDETMHSMLNETTDKAKQSNCELMETYNYLLIIREKAASMIQNENEENKAPKN